MGLILASQSPRRQELLKKITEDFIVVPADIDESSLSNETPEEYVLRMARQKALTVAKQHPQDQVLGCDTIVVDNQTILGKPHTSEKAYEMLKQLSGHTHQVYTAVCLVMNEKITEKLVPSQVTFFELTEKEITDYVATKEPLDKAGAYGIQGNAALFIKEIKGDYYSIMGLPIAGVYRMLNQN